MLSLPAGFCAAAAFSSSKLQPKYRGSAAAHSPQHMAKPWQEQQQLPLPQLASQLQKQQQQPRSGSPGAGTGMSLWTAMTAVAGGSAAAAVGQYKKMVRRPWCLQHICTGCNTLCRKDASRHLAPSVWPTMMPCATLLCNFPPEVLQKLSSP
jgi:hypothetical protein